MVDVTEIDVLCKSCEHIVNPDGSKYKTTLGRIGAFFLGVFGFFTGSAIGIATAGAGIAATIPLTIMGLYVGYKSGAFVAGLLDGVTCPECGYSFGR